MANMRDQYSENNVVSLLDPGVYAATTTPISVDLMGYDGFLVVLQNGTGGITFTGANRIDFLFQHSDDNSTWVNVVDLDVLGVTNITAGIIQSFQAAKTASVQKMGYRGNKRYIRLTATFVGTHGTGTGLSANVVRSIAALQPTP
jgi:hypothetical protein